MKIRYLPNFPQISPKKPANTGVVLTPTHPHELRAECPAITQHYKMTCLDFAHETAVFDLNSFLKKVESGPLAPPAHTGLVTEARNPPYQTGLRPPASPAMSAPPHRTQNTQVCALKRIKNEIQNLWVSRAHSLLLPTPPLAQLRL